MGGTSLTASSQDLAALFRAARPVEPDVPPSAALARQVGLGNVLAAALGESTAPPAALGVYRGLTKVGAGGMGVVYRAIAPDGHPVAIKVLSSDAGPQRLRFAREASVLKAIRHPRVVEYVESGETDSGAPYLVMEWLEGHDLAHHLRSGPLSIDDALLVTLQAAAGFAAAHDAGVVHRDVKPGNLFLRGGRLDDVRIIDFGIALGDGVGGDARLTTTGTAIGSPAYMAPEQIRGVTDARTDIYALGATLFECVAGRPPFQGDSTAAVLLGVLAEAPPSLVALRPDTPSQIDVLVGRMLAKQPAHRPATMKAVITELSGIVAERRSAVGSRPVLSRSERRAIATARPDRAHDTPGALLGRGRELGLLSGELDGAWEDETATVVVLSGPPAIGCSALLLEFAARVKADGRFAVAVVRPRPEEAGVPFSTLERVLSQLPSATLKAPAVREFRAQHAELTEGFGHLHDPLSWADRLLLSFHAVVDVLAAADPVAVFIEDIDAIDLSSRRYLELALRLLAQRPLALVAIAQSPEGLVTAPDQRRVELPLAPLTPGLTRRLASSWAPNAPEELLNHVTRLSGGNPGYLRELCRTVASGRPVAGENFAELVWARLAALDDAARRLLRAAAIVGDAFTSAAVAELIGSAEGDPGLEASLASLVETGFIVAAAQSTDGRFHFASDLVYLAAYGLCTEADLRSGHGVAGRFLESNGQRGAHVGRHFRAAGDLVRAQVHYVHGLRAALAGADEAAASRCLAAARECGPEGPEQALLAAQFAFWRGDPRGALEAALSALSATSLSSVLGLQLASFAITAAGQLGRNDEMKTQALSVLHSLEHDRAVPTSQAVREARLIALGRAITQLDAAGDPGAASLREAVETSLAEDPRPLGADARAWVARVRGSAANRHFDDSIRHFEAAHLAHGEAGDPRSAAQVGLYLGSYYNWCGAFELARAAVLDAIGVARRLGASYLVTWGRYVLGKVQLEVDPPEEALRLLEAISLEAEHSPRIAQGALVYAALAALRADSPERALALVTRVLERNPAPAVAIPAHAVRLRAERCAGLTLSASSGRCVMSAPIATLVEHCELVRLGQVDWLSATSDEHGVAAALSAAEADILRKADTLADPVRRNRFLTGPHLVVETLVRARRETIGPHRS